MFNPKVYTFFAAAFLCAALDLRAQEGDSSAPPANGSSQQTAVASGKEVIDNGKEVISNSGTAPALGTGNFSSRSPFHVTVAVREGYDDNVYSSKLNPIGSFFTNGSAELGYKFGSPRTIFDFQLIGGATYYYNRPFGQQYDTNDSVSVSLEQHATPRLTLSLTGYATYQSEPDFNNSLGINRRAGNFFYSTDKIAA